MSKLNLEQVTDISLNNGVSKFLQEIKADNALLPGVEYFYLSLESRMRTIVSSPAAKPENNIYNPLVVQQLTTDITALLNRCLMNQREYFALEQGAVEYALRYLAFKEQEANNKNLEQSNYLIEILDERIKNGNDDDKKLFGALSTALGNRKGIVADLYVDIEKEQSRLKKRHEQNGSAFNFAERAASVWSFLSDDLLETYIKMRALSKGISYLYDSKDLALPEWATADIPGDEPHGKKECLGVLVKWIRQVIILVNREEESLGEFELVIPLKKVGMDQLKFTTGVLSDDMYKAMIKIDRTVASALPLADGIPKGMSNLRVLSVGASFAWGAAVDVGGFTITISRIRTSMILFPPAMPKDLAFGKHTKRCPVVLSDVALLEPNSPPRMESPEYIQNIFVAGYPDDTNWTVLVDPLWLKSCGDLSARSTDLTDLLQIYLHFRVVGKLAADPNSWRRDKSA